ncbi:hypothetical protein [Flavobacterium sp. J27]|uniref:HYC_CC_PP family protein n=1 Tax=Flavobacterium sp. J27 TaxID=2060419 RepID=UPI00102F41E9|nr:hypothetical protein [Flavobacterium sp. J27]
MHFRKSTSLLLAVIFLFSNLGLAFNMHYCHDELSSVSIDYQLEDVCVENQKGCCAVADNHSSCCSNKIVEIEKNTANTIVSNFQFAIACPIIITNIFLFQWTEVVEKKELPNFYCDSNAPPFYKLYCQLVFYA